MFSFKLAQRSTSHVDVLNGSNRDRIDSGMINLVNVIRFRCRYRLDVVRVKAVRLASKSMEHFDQLIKEVREGG